METECYLDRLLGKDLVNLLKCSICLDYFTEPTILPCGHTFCFTCLKNIGEYQIRSAGPLLKDKLSLAIACPSCRSNVLYGQIVQREKSVVKCNYALSAIIESLKTLEDKNPEKIQCTHVKRVEQSTNTDTVAYTKERMKVIEKNVDSVLQAVRMKGSIISDVRKEINTIREEQDHFYQQQQLYLNGTSQNFGTDMSAYANFPISQYSNVNIQSMINQGSLIGFNSQLPTMPSFQNLSYQTNSAVDPGHVDPAILSYSSPPENGSQYGGTMDANALQYLRVSQYGQ